jgi:hypothetical protein
MGDYYGISPNHLGQPPGLGGLLHLGSFSSHMSLGIMSQEFLPVLAMFLLLWLGFRVTPGYRSLASPLSLLANAGTGRRNCWKWRIGFRHNLRFVKRTAVLKFEKIPA